MCETIPSVRRGIADILLSNLSFSNKAPPKTFHAFRFLSFLFLTTRRAQGAGGS